MAQSEASTATSDAPNGTLPRQRAVLVIGHHRASRLARASHSFDHLVSAGEDRLR